MWGLINIELKGYEQIGCYTYYVAFSYDLDLGFSKVRFWKCCISGMGVSTHLDWKGCELGMMLDAQWDWPWAMVHGK